MRKITLFITVLLFTAFNYTAQAQVTQTAVCTAGNLATVAASYLNTVTNLTVTGTIDARDFKTMRDAMPLLAVIDLSGTTVVAYTGTAGTAGTTYTVYPANGIPDFAFCTPLSYRSKLTLKSFIYPASVITIGEAAFSGCSGFTGSLTIPASVTTIGKSAFNYCTGFTGSLTIPASVTTIGNSAFSGCRGFTGSLTIPSSVTTIGDYAFAGCTGIVNSKTVACTAGSLATMPISYLKTITNLTVTGTIDARDFKTMRDEMPQLEGLDLSGSTVVAFTGKYGTEDFYIRSYAYPANEIPINALSNKSTDPMYKGLKSFIYPASVTAIGNAAFYDCKGLTGSLTIPAAVKTIGESAFYNCSGFTGSLTIPASITTIEKNTFYNCYGLSGSLTIPASVTTIGASAFYNCSFTGSLTFPASVKTIGTNAFYDCSGLSISQTVACTAGNLATVASTEVANLTVIGTIDARDFKTMRDKMLLLAVLDLSGSTVVAYTGTEGTYGVDADGYPTSTVFPANEIPNYAFDNHWIRTTLKSFIYPSSVTIIGDGAFAGCAGLTGSFIIPSSVTTIGAYAFSKCSGFKGSLTIPSSVTTIGNGAFQNCSGFTGSLTIPSSVKTISNSAFYNCTGFTGSLTIPASVTTIGGAAFSDCSGFKGSLTIAASADTIGVCAFYGCTGFTGSLIISSSVTTIGEKAFYNCGGFPGSLTIPSSVKTIGTYAFAGCTGFTGSLTIPASVKTIGNYAFSNCTGFTGSLTIPASVTYIGNSAFWRCSGFKGSLTIAASADTISNYAFYGCSGFTGSLTIPASVTTIGEKAFCECGSFTGSLTIPSKVTTIGNSAFYHCSGFTDSLTIGSSVTTIGKEAFYNCNGFNGSLTISASVTSFGQGAFAFCSGFTGSLTIPSSVKTIEDNAFTDCSGFKGSLTIPASVSYIGGQAFYGCTGLTSIYAWASTPIPLYPKPWGSEYFFLYVNKTIPLHVPVGSKALYATANHWKDFTNIVDDLGATSQTVNCTAGNLATLATGYLTTITNLTITGTIDARDFATMRDEMPLLESIDLSGATIVDYTGPVQGGAPSLISENKSVLANNATNATKGLALYSSAANTIPANAFYNPITQVGKKSLLSITIPSTITAIGDNAFYDCTNLASIFAMATTPIDISASTNVFYGVNKTTCILHVPVGSTAKYAAANQWQDFTNIVADIVQIPLATTASDLTTTSFTANWNSVEVVSKYFLDVATDNAFVNMVTGYNNIDVSNTLSKIIEGLSSGTTYYYRVRAFQTNSTSASSNIISATTPKSEQLIIFNALANSIYGATAFNVSASGGASGNAVTFTSSNNNVATCSGTNGATITIVSAGNCTIKANQLGNNNYINALEVAQPLIVTKAPLTVTANAKTKVYGEANPAFDATITGFVNGQTLATSGVIGKESITCSANATTSVGTADIIASLGTLVSTNYTFYYSNGLLTITPKPVALDNLDAQTSISIFPNPATSQITVSELGSLVSDKSVTLSVIDVAGSTLLIKDVETSLNTLTIDVSTFKSGIYFIAIQTCNGSVVKRFIKE